jgi:hypothetical protein
MDAIEVLKGLDPKYQESFLMKQCGERFQGGWIRPIGKNDARYIIDCVANDGELEDICIDYLCKYPKNRINSNLGRACEEADYYAYIQNHDPY